MSGTATSAPTEGKNLNLELPLWNKVYSAHRLSILAYMPKETTAIDPHTGLKNSIMAWRNGERIDLGLHVAEEEANIGKVPAEHDCYSTLEPTEFDPIKVVCFGDKRPDGFVHRVQWLAARRNNILYIAFKGTNNAADMLIDASITDVIAPSGARYHSGFYSAVQPELVGILRVCNVILMDDANCVEDVVFCGHSLGGAYATVAALELAASPFWKAEKRPEAVTFGAPLVVTQSANGHANVPSALLGCMPRMTHFVANYDIVPRMLALKQDSVLKMALAVPSTILQNSGYLKTWSVGVFLKMTSPLDKVGGVIQQAQVLREQYVAVGTYVFAITTDNGRQAHVQVVTPMKHSFTSHNTDASELLAFYPEFDHKDDPAYLIRRSLGDHKLGDSYWPAVRLCTFSPTPDPDDGDRRQWDDIRDQVGALKSKADKGSDITEKELWAAYTPSFLYSHALPPHMLSETLSGEAKELLQKVRADALRLAVALTEKRREVLGLNDKTHVDFLGDYTAMNTDVRPPPPHKEEEPKSKKRFSLVFWKKSSGSSELDKSQHVLSPVVAELENMHTNNGYPLFVISDN
ncbi:hypothetical protein DIPPA_02639 [Diplonema papillatum]|nr:hypothetical protein DIPPA_02639 [Diplonema papillatum]